MTDDQGETFHKLIFGDSQNMKELQDGKIHLVVTSPHKIMFI